MSNREAKQRPLPRNLGNGLTRHWRIGDRDIPWQVASQQSLPPFLPASALDPQSSPNSSLGHRSQASENPVHPTIWGDAVIEVLSPEYESRMVQCEEALFEVFLVPQFIVVIP